MSRRDVSAVPSFDLQLLESRILLAGEPVLSLGQVTSNSLSVNWPAIPDATEIRLYLAPEPSATPGAALPGQVLVGTLPGNATSYDFAQLAPDTHAFLRVEAILPGPDLASNIHAKTLGGPGATLSTPVREVHSYGPNVLQVVLADLQTNASGSGNDGAAWKAGPWTVTRVGSGASIPVTNVYRHSVVTGNPEAEVGYAAPYSDQVVSVDHRIYLQLGQNIGQRDVLQIQGPFGTAVTLPFSDLYTETPVIQVNQVGYNPRATQRWAYVSGWMGDGGGLSLSSFPAGASMVVEPVDPMAARTTAVSSLPVSVRSGNDAAAGAPVNQIDLASVPAAEGVRYRVRIPGVGVSWATAVSENAVFKTFYTVQRGLFHNRWAGDLNLQNTEWARPQDHVTRPDGTPTVYTSEQADWTAMHPSNTPLTGPRNVIGGHHDAGDFDIRPMHTVVPQLLMRTYEATSTNTFSDNQLTIPESGNTIPDILDEALWNLAAWEALQEADGGVRAGVESWRHPWGYYTADQEPLPYWTYARDKQVTARAAGLFAQAARLVAPYDTTRANQLQARAVNAYNYAKANGAADSYLAYGAGELYRLTGTASYKTDFEAAWNRLNVNGNGAFDKVVGDQGYMGDYVSDHRVMPDFLQGYLGATGAQSSYVNVAKTNTGNSADLAANRVINSAHAHRNPRTAGGTQSWGKGTSLGRDLDMLYARLQLGGLTAAKQQEYFNAMSLTADYILGANPNGLVYFTGLGSRSVQQVLHLDSIAMTHMGEGQMPGIPVYGPVNSYGATGAHASAFAANYPNFNSLPDGIRYADARVMVGTNEFTVWESQAPHAQLFGMLLGQGRTAPQSYKPGHADHRNPLPGFGPATNRAPVVDAGADRAFNLPATTINLLGQMVDDGLTAGVTTTWSKVSGPLSANVTFANASAPSTTATFPQAGTYVLRLTANDGQKISTDDVTIIVKDPSQGLFTNGDFENGNLAGWSTSDSSKVVVEPNAVGGNGNYVVHVKQGLHWATAVSTAPQKEGGTQQANTNYELRFRMKWVTAPTQQNVNVHVVGNGGAAFVTRTLNWSDHSDSNWHDYVVSFNSGGNDKFYVDFKHEGGGGTDREYYLDNIFVRPVTSNAAPAASAGADQTITLPSTATLAGSASDDGQPNAALATTWSKLSGPGAVAFGNTSLLSTSATFSTAGTYVLRLSAFDGSLTTTDDVTVTVNPAPSGGGTLYSTGFDTNVASDWTIGNASITTGSGDSSFLATNSGWGVLGTASLAGSNAVNRANVTVTGRMGVMGGNPNMYSEIAARTTNATDGIRLRITGSYDAASVYLYDGATLIASQTNVAGLRTQFAPVNFELNVSGSSVTASITQTAGSGGGQTWTDKTVTLTGTIANSTAAGNVRWSGVSYTDRPRLYDVTVTAPNSAAVATNDGYSVNEDGVLTVNAPGLLTNDTDADNNTLTAIKVTNPAHGAVTVNANGSFVYTPAANYFGPDSFTYKVNDGTVDSNAATVNITVNSVNDAPVAANNSYTAQAGNPFSVSAPGILANDTDVEGSALTAIKVTNPSHGTVTVSANGSLVYTPTAGYSGPDSFTYKANDGTSDGNVATVSFTVEAPSGSGQTLYETGFDTNVSSDWSMSNAAITTGTGDNSFLAINYGWGVTGSASLAGSSAVNEDDVTVTGKMAVRAGSPNAYAEIAARTTNATDGIRLRVYGSYDNADVYLYDGATLVASQMDVPGLRTQFAPVNFTLNVTGNTVTAMLVQTAGSGGGQTWTDKTVTLTGNVANTTGAGNVRFAGHSYPEQVRLYDIKVEAPIVTPQSIFSNGGFESGNLDGYSTGTPTGVAVVPNIVGGSGSYVLHVTAGDWGTPLSTYPQRATAGQLTNTDYVLSFAIKWEATTSKTVRARVVNEAGATLSFLDVSADTSWQTYTLSFNSGDTYNNGVEPFYIELIHEGGGGAARSYYLDDILVSAV